LLKKYTKKNRFQYQNKGVKVWKAREANQTIVKEEVQGEE